MSWRLLVSNLHVAWNPTRVSAGEDPWFFGSPKIDDLTPQASGCLLCLINYNKNKKKKIHSNKRFFSSLWPKFVARPARSPLLAAAWPWSPITASPSLPSQVGWLSIHRHRRCSPLSLLNPGLGLRFRVRRNLPAGSQSPKKAGGFFLPFQNPNP